MTRDNLYQYDGIIRLSHRVVVYVPSESNGNPIPDRDALVDHVLSTLSDLCGGATASDAVGYWMSPAGSLVKEPVTLAFAYCSDLEPVIDGLLQLALELKKRAGQESVAFEVDNELFMI